MNTHLVRSDPGNHLNRQNTNTKVNHTHHTHSHTHTHAQPHTKIHTRFCLFFWLWKKSWLADSPWSRSNWTLGILAWKEHTRSVSMLRCMQWTLGPWGMMQHTEPLGEDLSSLSLSLSLSLFVWSWIETSHFQSGCVGIFTFGCC